MFRNALFTGLSCMFLASLVVAQRDSVPDYKTRKLVLLSSSAALTAGSLVYLYGAWYKNYSSGRFHFFNDNKEWLQMDKAGHFFTTYQTGRLMMDAGSWAGCNRKQQLVLGGTGFVYMTAIEVLDGFSSGWGFSWGDEVADVLGASAAMAQQAFWGEQRIQVKFSYAESGLAKYNPALLGDSWSTRLLKDYNAQTLWLSINPSTFIKRPNRFPKWLNVAFGYNAYGMLGGFSNNFTVVDEQGRALKFERVRRFYFSLDVDLTRIKTRSKFLKGVFSVVNILKFPAPALQFGQEGFRFYYLYY